MMNTNDFTYFTYSQIIYCGLFRRSCLFELLLFEKLQCDFNDRNNHIVMKFTEITKYKNSWFICITKKKRNTYKDQSNFDIMQCKKKNIFFFFW